MQKAACSSWCRSLTSSGDVNVELKPGHAVKTDRSRYSQLDTRWGRGSGGPSARLSPLMVHGLAERGPVRACSMLAATQGSTS